MTRASREEILEHVRRAIAELFEIEPSVVQLDTKVVEDLDLDSIDAIELAVRMEALTGQRFDPERFREMRTIRDVVDILDDILNGSVDEAAS
jgi:acyl carrier protein